MAAGPNEPAPARPERRRRRPRAVVASWVSPVAAGYAVTADPSTTRRRGGRRGNVSRTALILDGCTPRYLGESQEEVFADDASDDSGYDKIIVVNRKAKCVDPTRPIYCT